jgi:hypothetical protein
MTTQAKEPRRQFNYFASLVEQSRDELGLARYSMTNPQPGSVLRASAANIPYSSMVCYLSLSQVRPVRTKRSTGITAPGRAARLENMPSDGVAMMTCDDNAAQA